MLGVACQCTAVVVFCGPDLLLWYVQVTGVSCLNTERIWRVRRQLLPAAAMVVNSPLTTHIPTCTHMLVGGWRRCHLHRGVG
jgi:hypothetical protein